MLKFNRKTEYALIAMLYMAQKTAGELTTARELSDKFKISLELIGKILQQLTRSGLISSVQGVKGGYQLAQSIDDIFISKIIISIEGPIQLTNCGGDKNSSNCDRTESCIIREPVKNIQNELVQFFDRISLRDMQKNGFIQSLNG